MPLKTSQNEELPGINLTSMIDVLFLLIIFFMVGTRFTESEHQISLKLPKSTSPETMMDRPGAKIVNLYSDGTIEFEGRRLTSDQLTASLEPLVRNYPDLQVRFRPDTGVPVGQASQVMEAISRSGVQDIRWATTASVMPGTRAR
ncbi:MAG: biopolymer transporter ExbD [Planctomycetaceae bacterium]|jgi:biopolymer transport protein ExbD|nr:biopolymer transporter ExbD [Planctomycetaceae bacterium]